MDKEYKTIKTIEEITEEDILKETKFNTKESLYKYFQIDKDEDGYCIYGHICGKIPTSVTHGSYVKYWKTLNGVKRAIKRFVENGHWGFQQWFYKIMKGNRDE